MGIGADEKKPLYRNTKNMSVCVCVSNAREVPPRFM